MQPHRSDDDFLVLHCLRCIGFSTWERVASASGLDRGMVGERLEGLAARGFVARPEGAFGGWGLTDSGRRTDAEWAAAELDLTLTRSFLTGAYRSFTALNPQLLQICTDWQMRAAGRTHVLNDHADRDYDARVIDRLARIDANVQTLLASVAVRLGRFTTYANRLTGALERVAAGELSYLADNFDSYHIVWFQLHEDFLATLGLDRQSTVR